MFTYRWHPVTCTPPQTLKTSDSHQTTNTDPMNTTTNDTPPEDSAPFKWGDFRKYLSRLLDLGESNIKLARFVIQLWREVELLKAICLSLKSEIECMQVRQGDEKRAAEAMEKVAASLEAMTANDIAKAASDRDMIAGLLETVADHGDQQARAARYEKLPADQKQAFCETLGMPPGEIL